MERIEKRGVDFLDLCPIQEIAGNCLVNGNGDITFGFELKLPEVFAAEESIFENIYERLNHLCHRLPAGTQLHQQSFFYMQPFELPNGYNATAFTQRANQCHYTFRPVLRQFSRLFVTFTNNYSSGRISPIEGNPFIRALSYVRKRPFKKVSEFIAGCRSHYGTVRNGLESIPGIEVSVMDDAALLQALSEYFNLSYARQDKEMANVQPMDFGRNGEHFRIGNDFVQVISLSQEGSEVSSYYDEERQLPNLIDDKKGELPHLPNSIRLGGTMSFPVSIGLPCDHILNVAIEVLDNEKVMFQKKKEQVMLNFLSVFGVESAVDKQEDLFGYIKDISREGYRACRVGMNVILKAPSLERLGRLSDMALDAFGNMRSAHAVIENRDNANLFFCSCPGNMRLNYRVLYSTTEQSVNYFHLEGHYRSDKEGSIFTDLFGTPVMVNIKTPPKDIAPSNHAFVAGKTRSGKSFWLQGQIDESLARGEYVFQCDIGNSSKNSGKFNHARYLDLEDRESFGTNLFLTPQDAQDKYLLDDGKALFLRTILTMIWKRDRALSPDTEAVLMDLIARYYREYVNFKGELPSISSFFEYVGIYEKGLSAEKKRLFDFSSFRTVLESYLPDGAYGFLFNCNNPLTLHEPLVIYDLKAIENDATLLPLVGTIMMQQVNEMMMSDPMKDKLFIIDEAHKIFVSPVLARYVGYCYATQQKHGGRVYTCTQGVEDLEKLTKVGVANQIKDNTEILVLFDNQYLDKKRAILDLTAKDIRLLKGMEPGGKERRQFFLKIGKGTGSFSKLFYYDVSPLTRKVYSSVASEKAELEQLEIQYGSMAAAIKQQEEENPSN